MKKHLFLIAGLLILCTIGQANDEVPDLKALRKKLTEAIMSERTTDSLYQSLDKLKQKTPLVTAYMGALDALKAKHVWNPYSKIKYLNLSQKLMQQALVVDPHNIEILFIRFSIQHNVPGFLGYGKNLVADREEIINQLNHKNYGTTDKELTLSIIRFLIQSNRCTPQENARLSQQLSALS